MNAAKDPDSRNQARDVQSQSPRQADNTPGDGCPAGGQARRSFLKGLGLASMGLLTAGGASTALASLPPTKSWMPKSGDHLSSSNGSGSAKALTVDDIPENKDPLVAFPFDPKTKKLRDKHRANGVLLEKLKSSELNSEMAKVAAGGVLGYSQVCVHAGCTISTYQAQDKTYLCFCHGSSYYLLKDGEVASGPAPRALPNLPLKLASDGKTLLVAGRFNAPIGPE
jgi:rieske iron-sulfur protein